MKYEPHKYQKYAHEFLISHPFSALLIECGLGKTAITLSAINELIYSRFEIHKVLVVAPLRVCDVWREEVEKWDTFSNLKVSVCVGDKAERLYNLRRDADIYAINREMVSWLINDSGVSWKWDMLVLDELSSFKNHSSQRTKAIFKIRPKLKRIVGLTGTPTSNGLMDLFSEFRLLDGGQRLGRYIGRYREVYFVPDKRNGSQIFSYKPRKGDV